MKLLVLGCGQCGGRIASEFARLGMKARMERGIDIITDTFAINTDTADLTGLNYIKKEFSHRILIGVRTTSGHGVGKINEIAADIAKEDSDKILEAISKARGMVETDAFLLTASSAGGTGSGTMPILAQVLKDHYPEKPVYCMVVLPFKHEETTEVRSIYNTAVCLKSAYLVSDAVFLVDNQKFVKKGLSLNRNLNHINKMMAAPFYNMLCAGEEKHAEFVGSRTLDAGDIIQTLAGWTVIGHAQTNTTKPAFRFFSKRHKNFHDKAVESQEGIQTMSTALSDLSTKCEPRDAARALYLLSGPTNKMAVGLISELSNALKDYAVNASIRSGDYPRAKKTLEVSVILSELTNVKRVNEIFNKAIIYLANKKRRRGLDAEYQELETSFRDIPSLL